MKAIGEARAELVTLDNIESDARAKVLEGVAMLLARLYLRDLSERPRFVVAPAAGVEWIAAAYFGEVPTFVEGSKPTGPGRVSHVYLKGLVAQATGKGPDDACAQLLRAVAYALRDRVIADVAVFEMWMGERFDFGLVGKNNPHAPEPPIETRGEEVSSSLTRRPAR